MIGSKIQFSAPSEAIQGQMLEMTGVILDKINVASLVGDQNNEGHVTQQDCYLVANSNDKIYIVSPSQVLKYYPVLTRPN